MKNLNLICLICILLSVGCAPKGVYNFKQFLKKKTTNSKSYKSELAKKIEYPPIYRENKVEGAVFYIMKIDETGKFDLQVDSVELYHKSVRTSGKMIDGNFFTKFLEKSIKEVNETYLKNVDQPYQTRFSVLYDIEPYEKGRRIHRKYDFVVQREEVEIQIKVIQ